ncbi:MAG: molecular chaperone Tir [Gemmatimonadetes bacterium]|nr:molecular chaperone Tir [Gemmatimonadota bacterium]
MSEYFTRVKEFVVELEFAIDQEIPEEEIVIVHDEERGISNLVIDCEDSILVLEQLILELKGVDAAVYQRILQMNRDLVFGAFVLDEEGDKLLYRNTLALENLDLNELEGTINALSLGLAENGNELLSFIQQ